MHVCAVTCEDSFIRFENLAAATAGQTPAASGVTTIDGCQERCLADVNCAGFNWIRDGRDPSQKCLLYSQAVGATNIFQLFDLHVRQTCQSDVVITFVPRTFKQVDKIKYKEIASCNVI